MSRYVVTELEGWQGIIGGGKSIPGLPCHVIDTAWNHGLVATYRSEDYGRGFGKMVARQKAHTHAERLNASR